MVDLKTIDQGALHEHKKQTQHEGGKNAGKSSDGKTTTQRISLLQKREKGKCRLDNRKENGKEREPRILLLLGNQIDEVVGCGGSH